MLFTDEFCSCGGKGSEFGVWGGKGYGFGVCGGRGRGYWLCWGNDKTIWLCDDGRALLFPLFWFSSWPICLAFLEQQQRTDTTIITISIPKPTRHETIMITFIRTSSE